MVPRIRSVRILLRGITVDLFLNFCVFLRYARRSCAEVQERIRRLKRKNLVDEKLCDKYCEHCIKTGYIIDRLIFSLVDKNKS